MKQIDLADKVELKSKEGSTYICKSTSQSQVVSSSGNCNCSFRKAMQLPCKHIFAVHKRNDLTLFDPNLCAEYWTLQYYKVKPVFYT